MKYSNISAVFLLFSCALLPGFAAAHPLEWSVEVGGTGHHYEAVMIEEGVTWEEAQVMAEQMTFEGVSGHLATITSQGECDFVWNQLGDVVYYWIGGHQLPGDFAPDEGWVWVTGETWSFTHWNEGEPNNSAENPDGYENCLQVGRPGSVAGWNDLWPSAKVPGFIVEFDTNTVPDGTSSVGAVKARYPRP